MWLVILMMKLIFHINYYWPILFLANIELWKTQLSKIVQFLDSLLGPLLKTGLPLMKNALELKHQLKAF